MAIFLSIIVAIFKENRRVNFKQFLMIKLTKFDYKTLYDFTRTNKHLTIDLIESDMDVLKALSEIKKFPPFLDQALAVFARVKCYKNSSGLYSATETFKQLSETYEIEGQTFSKEEMKQLMSVFYYYPFSSWRKGHQSESSANSATPYFLWAQKLYNDIKYDEWDRTDPNLKLLMNRDLAPLVDEELEFPNHNELVWETIRVRSVTDGKEKRHEFSAYKANGLPDEVKCLPRLFQHMYLKTWIFAEPKPSMIIDLDEWDNNLQLTNQEDDKDEGLFF